jgi:hypothetical protein
MVAAAYPHSSSVEVALALPDDVEGEGLVDATHLTWRTMPVAVELGSADDLVRHAALLAEALSRVKAGAHDVSLPPERFTERERWLTRTPWSGRGTTGRST